MDEHLAAWQIAEFILGGLDGDELEEVYRHLDECGESWAGWRASFGLPVKARSGGESCAVAGSLKSSEKTFLSLSPMKRAVSPAMIRSRCFPRAR